MNSWGDANRCGEALGLGNDVNTTRWVKLIATVRQLTDPFCPEVHWRGSLQNYCLPNGRYF